MKSGLFRLESHNLNDLRGLPVLAAAYLGTAAGRRLFEECRGDLQTELTIEALKTEVVQILEKTEGPGTADRKSPGFKNIDSIDAGKSLNDIISGHMDNISEDSVVVRLVVLGKRSGVMPFFCSSVLAAMYLYKDEKDSDSIITSEYTEVYGIKKALERFSGIESEPEILQLVYERYNFLRDGRDTDFRKVELIKNAYSEGFGAEKKFRGCAQCTLYGLFEANGHADEAVFKSAGGMSGGMAMNGEGSCGGYAGGIMYMSLLRGRRLKQMQEDGDKAEQYLSYELAQELYRKFEETYNSVICRNIHNTIFNRSFCLLTKAVRDDFEKAGAHTDKCTGVIGTASAWVTEILYDHGELCGASG